MNETWNRPAGNQHSSDVTMQILVKGIRLTLTKPIGPGVIQTTFTKKEFEHLVQWYQRHKDKIT